MIMKKIYNWLLSSFGFKSKIQLCKTEKGAYVVKYGGYYLTSTLTMDSNEAEKSFNRVVEMDRGGTRINEIVIKEA